MPSAFLSRNSFNQLKRTVRQQLPGVQHTHVLEALARGLGQNTLAALNAKLSLGEDDAVHFFEFSYDELRLRLKELGYPDAIKWELDFSSNKDVFRIPKPFPMTLSDLAAQGVISFEQRQRFEQLLDQRRSILIVETVGSSKSTLMYVLLNEMSIRAPQDEFVLCQRHQEGPEFEPNVRRFVRMVNEESWPGGFPPFGDRRVAFDDIRDATAFRVLKSWSTYGGGLGTMYARSADDALDNIRAVVGGRGSDMVSEAVDVVVRMEHGDMPKVAEIISRGALRNPSEPPEFHQEWREPVKHRSVSPEEAGRYVLQDLKGLVAERFLADTIVPLDPSMPIIQDDFLMSEGPLDVQRRLKSLSFIPKHWRQVADGSWAPVSYFGTSHQALHGRQSDALAEARMEEMSRITAEGGRVLVVDPKADTDAVKALLETSGLTTELVAAETAEENHMLLQTMNQRGLTSPAPGQEPDATGDAKTD